MATTTTPTISTPASTSEKKTSSLQSAIVNWTDFAPLRMFGKKSFAQMRDIFFVLQSQKPQAQPIKRKSYMTIGIVPLSIITNYGLQKTFPNSFGGKRFYNFFIDLIWHTATFLLILKLNMGFTQNSDFIAFKNKLVQQRNTKYLAHLYENNKKYKISYEDSLQNVKLNPNQITNLKFQCEKAAVELRNVRKQEKNQQIQSLEKNNKAGTTK